MLSKVLLIKLVSIISLNAQVHGPLLTNLNLLQAGLQAIQDPLGLMNTNCHGIGLEWIQMKQEDSDFCTCFTNILEKHSHQTWLFMSFPFNPNLIYSMIEVGCGGRHRGLDLNSFEKQQKICSCMNKDTDYSPNYSNLEFTDSMIDYEYGTSDQSGNDKLTQPSGLNRNNQN